MPTQDHDMKQEQPFISRKPAPIFYISAIFITLFVLWGALAPSHLNQLASQMLDWMITNFGWFYMLITAIFVFFIMILALTPLGKIKLGQPDEEPEYSWFSWIGMLFAAGIGVGFVFWGVAEPVLYYLDTPVGYEPGTRQAAIAAFRYSAFHWALHPWAIFSIIGLNLAYVLYRKNKPALVSSAFYPILGDRINGWIGQTIDILAVIATCTGVATTFGLSAVQITGGLSYLTPIPNHAFVQIIIIAIVSVLFMLSAASGVDKGIKILSNVNIIIAALLFLFVLIVGPTLFIAELFVTTLGGYITNLIPMSLTLTPFSDSEWLGTNTIFFWAWHISWAPFVGLFIARISKGRTVREFISGVLIVPALVAILWFTTFGGTAIHLEMFGPGGIAETVLNQVELALFITLAELPFSSITGFLSIVLIFIFFITSADTATYVLGTITSRGHLNPSLMVKIIWGVLIAGTAAVLLLSGEGGLGALQTASIVAAFPFAIIMTFMIATLLISFIRERQAQQRIHKRDEIKHVSQEVKEEIIDDVSAEVKDQMIENITTDDSFRDHMLKDMKEDVIENVTSDFIEEIREDIKDSIKEELHDEVKKEVYEEVRSEILDEVKKDNHPPKKD